jgi:hypothetical protein
MKVALLAILALAPAACAKPCTNCPDISGQFSVTWSCPTNAHDSWRFEIVEISQYGSRVIVAPPYGGAYSGILCDDDSVEFDSTTTQHDSGYDLSGEFHLGASPLFVGSGVGFSYNTNTDEWTHFPECTIRW